MLPCIYSTLLQKMTAFKGKQIPVLTKIMYLCTFIYMWTISMCRYTHQNSNSGWLWLIHWFRDDFYLLHFTQLYFLNFLQLNIYYFWSKKLSTTLRLKLASCINAQRVSHWLGKEEKSFLNISFFLFFSWSGPFCGEGRTPLFPIGEFCCHFLERITNESRARCISIHQIVIFELLW